MTRVELQLLAGAILLTALPALPQTPPKPFQAQASSTISYSPKKDEEAVEIANVAFEVTGDSVPGRPSGSRLVLRNTTHSRQILGDKGVEATVTLEAWPLGADLQAKPLYALSLPAIEARTLDGAVWVIDRSLDPDVNWWSLYQLGTGRRLFDTYVEMLRFTVSRENGDPRYAGLEVPPDDATDARLHEPHVVAVLAYASAEKVIREALITADSPGRARDLRSYWDTERTVALVERPAALRVLRTVLTAASPGPARTVTVSIPIVKDDLDIAHAEVPAGLHVAAFRR